MGKAKKPVENGGKGEEKKLFICLNWLRQCCESYSGIEYLSFQISTGSCAICSIEYLPASEIYSMIADLYLLT